MTNGNCRFNLNDINHLADNKQCGDTAIMQQCQQNGHQNENGQLKRTDLSTTFLCMFRHSLMEPAEPSSRPSLTQHPKIIQTTIHPEWYMYMYT